MSDAAKPCGQIASCTHCCEYHGIHSDDDLVDAIGLLRRAERLIPNGHLNDDVQAFLRRFPTTDPTRGVA